MNIVKRIKKELNYLGVPKEKRLDYYLQKIISDKTSFNINKIDLLYAEKTNMEKYNEFNSFIFNYRGITYKLLDDKLDIIEDFNI